MEKNARVACIRWFGPFRLKAKKGDAAKERLKEIRDFDEIAHQGLYMFVGQKGVPLIGTLFSKRRPLYVGLVEDFMRNNRFKSRFSDHLGENLNTAKLSKIEKIGKLDSIWLGVRESAVNLQSIFQRRLDNNANSHAHAEKSDIAAVENLLIHLMLPLENSDDTDSPTDRRILINYFDTDESRSQTKWNPDFLPDLIDFNPQEQEAIAVWVGCRSGVKPRIKKGIKAGMLK